MDRGFDPAVVDVAARQGERGHEGDAVVGGLAVFRLPQTGRGRRPFDGEGVRGDFDAVDCVDASERRQNLASQIERDFNRRLRVENRRKHFEVRVGGPVARGVQFEREIADDDFLQSLPSLEHGIGPCDACARQPRQKNRVAHGVWRGEAAPARHLARARQKHVVGGGHHGEGVAQLRRRVAVQKSGDDDAREAHIGCVVPAARQRVRPVAHVEHQMLAGAKRPQDAFARMFEGLSHRERERNQVRGMAAVASDIGVVPVVVADHHAVQKGGVFRRSRAV